MPSNDQQPEHAQSHQVQTQRGRCVNRGDPESTMSTGSDSTKIKTPTLKVGQESKKVRFEDCDDSREASSNDSGSNTCGATRTPEDLLFKGPKHALEKKEGWFQVPACVEALLGQKKRNRNREREKQGDCSGGIAIPETKRGVLEGRACDGEHDDSKEPRDFPAKDSLKEVIMVDVIAKWDDSKDSGSKKVLRDVMAQCQWNSRKG
ncbi:hypothetical protein BJ508DRAFT_367023 [Ascobolus immersus RN42]|uniref:Uncharacterized protein n=1 Tax=Ascobolus immersus RN42 TaxID=1160509 RepID=A0A3N4HFD1_ASCIM|nr:hypothetical protein BJ508DRAFT_367023 [Ascobolus immersus RN42]